MSNPQSTVLNLLYGRWCSQTLYTGVKLDIFEVIGDKSMQSAEIAQKLNLDAALLYRLLRALASLELLNELPDKYFSITEAGKFLKSDHPQSLRDMTLLREGPEHTAVWKYLPDMIRDGTQNGFVREFGYTAFDYAAHEPTYAAAFDAGMSSQSRLQTTWILEALHDYNFAPITHLCDVGGGQGHLLCHLLVRYPHLVGTILERPSVIQDMQTSWAQTLKVRDRCTYVAGDMFAEVPTADAYIMKMILHDWNDDECIQILSNMKHRASAAGRVFIVEHIVSETNVDYFATLFDIHMLCWGTGRERTRQEYTDLLKRAGWNYVTSWFPSNRIIGVIEGALAK